MTTPADRYRAVNAILDGALDLDPPARRAYVEQATADPLLRAEVLAALKAHEDSEGFLERAALPFAGSLVDGAEAMLAPPDLAMVGPFRITGVVGQGGMGTVYRGERADGQFTQRVAIKVIQRPSPGLLRRFLDERRILARLEHPNIARLVDGGVTADGLPYYAMELVDGEPIDRHCDSRSLSLEQRLRLFEAVCEAVSFAQQHLVVDRDLKPSNILVTTEGRVKLLDFGIAKVLDSPGGAEGSTKTGEFLMTPEFAAPEQARGQAVTTATDVYALGVLLYQLLTGKRPYLFEERSPAAIERVICEVDPPRPSATFRDDRSAADTEERARTRGASPARLARQLSGDLDAVIMKALEKEPARRYPGAAALWADVASVRSGLPVVARPPSRFYHLSKLVRRNRAAFAAAAAAAVVLIAATAFSAAQMQEARLQRDVAFAKSRLQEAQSLVAMEVAQDTRGPEGQPLGLAERLMAAERMIWRKYASEPKTAVAAALPLSVRLESVGRFKEQREVLGRVEEVARREGLPNRVALVECERSISFLREGHVDSARVALDRGKAALSADTTDRGIAENRCLRTEGRLYIVVGRPDSAVEPLTRGIALAKVEQEPRSDLVATLSDAYTAMARHREALASTAQTEAIYREEGLLNEGTISELAFKVGTTMVTLGEFAGADSVARAAMGALAGTTGERSNGFVNLLRGLALLRLGQLDSADYWLRVVRRDLTEGGPATATVGGLASLLPPAFVQLRIEQGRVDDAKRSMPDLPRGSAPRRANFAWFGGAVRRLEGDRLGGRTMLEDTLRLLFPSGKPPTTVIQHTLAAAEWSLEDGEPRVADSLARVALGIAAVDSLAHARSGYVGRAELLMARAALALSDSTKARQAVTSALPALRFGYGAAHPRTRAAEAFRDSLGQ